MGFNGVGMIESYDFGVMVVNGKRYTSDLIIYQEKVFDGWWRKEGHRLYMEDLNKIFSFELNLKFWLWERVIMDF
jgi:hypothetical protein